MVLVTNLVYIDNTHTQRETMHTNTYLFVHNKDNQVDNILKKVDLL